jgi:arginine/lysine/ornithine decarboxylase
MGAGLEQSSVFHLQGDMIAPEVLQACGDLLGTTSPSVLIYAALDGWRREVQQGHELLGNAVTLAHQTRAAIEQIGGLHVHGEAGFYGPGRATELDPLQIIIDITALGVDGYHAADWLRDQHHIDLHVSDHRRVSAQLSYADSEQTATRLVHALTDLVHCASELPPAAKVTVPSPEGLRLELVHTPRNTFFAPAEQVPVGQATEDVAAEMLKPYPPGIPPSCRANGSPDRCWITCAAVSRPGW